jgi:hypothetical protein
LEFWTYYGGHIGFDVRINDENKSKLDGVITSSRYVCSNEGYRRNDKRDHKTKCHRAETRSGCKARMGITVDLEVGNSELYDLVLEHNHDLYCCKQANTDREVREYESRKKLPRIKMGVSILLQTSKIYTPIVFEQFQNEFEKSMAAYIKALEQHNEFTIDIDTMQEGSVFVEECKVIGNYSEQSISCRCRQFKRIGLLCSHALKVLDILNIKSLPERYILKQWSREARSSTIKDSHGNIISESLLFTSFLE